MLGNAKGGKAPKCDSTANKLTNWIFFMRHYLNIMEVTNGNMCVKFEDIFLEGKALIWL